MPEEKKHIKVSPQVHESLKRIKAMFEIKNPRESYTLSDVIAVVLSQTEVELTKEDIQRLKKFVGSAEEDGEKDS